MAWWNFICRYDDDDDDDDDEDDDEFGFNDASTHEGHLRQNCISTWFSWYIYMKVTLNMRMRL